METKSFSGDSANETGSIASDWAVAGGRFYPLPRRDKSALTTDANHFMLLRRSIKT